MTYDTLNHGRSLGNSRNCCYLLDVDGHICGRYYLCRFPMYDVTVLNYGFQLSFTTLEHHSLWILLSSSEDRDLEEDIWGVAGLVLGLATSVSALYRAGELETVIKIKKMVISWLPNMNSLFQSSDLQGGKSDIILALGSCIALPTIVTFCQRMELMDDNELEHIVLGFKKFISELISVKESGVLHHSLLMASCIGAGTVISCILNEGVHSVEVECVKSLLELFRKCYSNPFPFLVHLGGMLGVVAAMGAGTGILVYMNFPNYTRQSTYQKEDSSSVTTPLLSSSVCEPYLTSLVQEMFLVAQNPDNHQLQQFASWALAFLRHHLWSKERLGVDDGNVAETNSKSVSHNFPEDSMVLKLSLWLMEFKNTEQGSTIHAGTIVAILGCLSRAPRLEKLFGDVGYHFCSLNSYKEYDTNKKYLLRLSCWKGLYECLNEVSVDTSSHISHVERCMEVLFTLLPVVESSGSVVAEDTSSVKEWSEAVRCLGKAPQGWLLDFLKVSQEEFVQSSFKSIEVQKKVHAKVKLVKTGSLPLIELGKMKSYILNFKSQGIWDVLLEVAAVLYHAEIGFKRQWLIDALEISCVTSFPSQALQFIGLLSATCCKYMPFIIVDQQTVLNDLPVTLVSLLAADKSWNVVAETVVSHLFSSTERIYDWTMHIADSSYVEGSQTIDESENHMGDFLLQVMHHTCVLLKEYLPLDKQLKLASMVVA
ncbi:unnamed protein product [Vicia faba]|uniref:Protein RST1 n=1 Tax=Vicia faba TaxID=3906 RepID=A0AAV0YKK5_VICFA|nr:unnamed protein product [Vicia faba]